MADPGVLPAQVIDAGSLETVGRSGHSSTELTVLRLGRSRFVCVKFDDPGYEPMLPAYIYICPPDRGSSDLGNEPFVC